MARPCVPPFYLYLLFLIAPLAVSPHPTLAKRGVSSVSGPVSISLAPTATPSATATPKSELSAVQGSDFSARLQARAGTPITTFEDGAVLEVSSGVATNLPAAPTPSPIQNAQNPPPPNAPSQSQAVQNPSDPRATVAAQPSNADTNIVTTPAPAAPSTTAPALLPAQGSTQVPTTLSSSPNVNGGTRSTTGGQSSTVRHTSALQPLVSVFTTVDSNGSVYTSSTVFSSTSHLATTSVEQVDHSQTVTPGVADEPPPGDNPPFLSQPGAAAGVIIAGVVAGLALVGLFILIRRHRKQMQRREELQSVNSDDDLFPVQSASDPFSSSRRYSFRSDSSSTYEWHVRSRAELEAMEEANRTPVTYFTPPPTENEGPFVGSTAYTYIQTVTIENEPTSLSAVREDAQMSPFADHAAVGYAPAAPMPLVIGPPTYVDLQRQQYPPINTGLPSLVPLARAPPLRTRSRTRRTGSPTSPASPTPFGSPPTAQTTSAVSPQPPPRRNDLPLSKRTSRPHTARTSAESTSGSSHPSTDRRSAAPSSRPSTTEKGARAAGVRPQERNPFEDADSINEEDLASADAHASYFLGDFQLPELEIELGFGLGSTRASIEDVLGGNERLRTYSDSMSVVTVTEGEYRGPMGAEVVVPIVTVQAPSTEDGISLLSSEVDPAERMQSPDEESLFYMGGPRGFTSLTAIGAGRR